MFTDVRGMYKKRLHGFWYVWVVMMPFSIEMVRSKKSILMEYFFERNSFFLFKLTTFLSLIASYTFIPRDKKERIILNEKKAK